MAAAAAKVLPEIDGGVVVTKYGHVLGDIPGVVCCEGGHPVPDEGSFAGTRKALALVANPTAEDSVIFLLSGGGSALFESPLIPPEELQDITRQLLACGADIVEMNTVRKRLPGVKGGRFAQALHIARKYGLKLSDNAWKLLAQETPKALDNVTTQITGSVRELCAAAGEKCAEMGYTPILLTDQLCCEAREAGSLLAFVARTHAGGGKKLAYLAGGETVVHLTGKGKGGRNQELALAGAEGLSGLDACLFSVGSDGTDGPTEAAGGYVDGDTKAALDAADVSIFDVLQNNDAFHALEASGGLIVTGPTGTNVNDVAVLLIGG